MPSIKSMLITGAATVAIIGIANRLMPSEMQKYYWGRIR